MAVVFVEASVHGAWRSRLLRFHTHLWAGQCWELGWCGCDHGEPTEPYASFHNLRFTSATFAFPITSVGTAVQGTSAAFTTFDEAVSYSDADVYVMQVMMYRDSQMIWSPQHRRGGVASGDPIDFTAEDATWRAKTKKSHRSDPTGNAARCPSSCRTRAPPPERRL